MQNKLDAATIRELLAVCELARFHEVCPAKTGQWQVQQEKNEAAFREALNPTRCAELLRYALELSDENERLKILAGRDAAAMMSDIMMQRSELSKVEKLRAEADHFIGLAGERQDQLQSQAAELERLRAELYGTQQFFAAIEEQP